MAITFFFLAAERKKITKKKDCRLPLRSGSRYTNERSDVESLPKKRKGPASFFCREAEKSAGVGKKMQTANFLFVSFFFCSGKRKMKRQV